VTRCLKSVVCPLGCTHDLAECPVKIAHSAHPRVSVNISTLLTDFHKIRCLEIMINCTDISLWSGGQSSWLQIQRSGFDSRRY
jgi:hypothetical protein